MVEMLAVVGQQACDVRFYDAGSYELVGKVDVPPQPHEAAYDSKRRLVYVSHTYDSGWYFEHPAKGHLVSVIDVDTRVVVRTIDLAPENGPHDLRLDDANDVLYVSVEATATEPGALLAVDPDTGEVRRRIAAEAPGPHWFAMTADGRRAYTSNKEAPFLSVVDIEDGRMAGRVEVPGSEGIAFAGGKVFVAAPVLAPGPSRGETGLRVIDTATDEIVGTVWTEHRISAVHATAGGLVLAAEMRAEWTEGDITHQNGLLHVYDAATVEEIATVPIGTGVLTIRSTSDGATAYVANAFTGTVTVIDLRAFEAVHTIEAGAGAHGLAWIPAVTG
ncbi:YncE family protein [Amycolatopsis minnesotensis]|uniref:YncE family protein n=2 Tax=Amycolatopsis minnesotensis TaxID=337894 RepID=A0ABP5CVN3_9PSEU